ncbi:hypothetical protein FGO68_gene9282 [Halteria grandinella]|uniref:CN hydrolase domain-containing protein n=1 Tax=Halteria grandinella TaxID=5974 RepID=A0A8J8NDA7_HALGN|nr:hypothetical protein FGO68_gene9282 [Halteria grandinella]
MALTIYFFSSINLQLLMKASTQLHSLSSQIAPSRKSTIGVIQLCSINDIEVNYSKIASFVKDCANKGAQLVCLPENFAFMGGTPEEMEKIKEPVEGPLIKRYAHLAVENGVWLSLGGYQEAIEGSTKRYNTHIIINDKGEIVNKYKKLHLFEVQMAQAGGLNLSESTFCEPGMELPKVIQSPFGPLGPMICYDLRFPELARSLVTRGAQLLFYPSAFTVKTGSAHWELLLRTRAVENQCYVIASAQTGQHNEKRASYGHSMVVDPWGDIIGQMSDKEGFFVCEIDLDYLDKVRGNMACLTHMRKDIL